MQVLYIKNILCWVYTYTMYWFMWGPPQQHPPRCKKPPYPRCFAQHVLKWLGKKLFLLQRKMCYMGLFVKASACVSMSCVVCCEQSKASKQGCVLYIIYMYGCYIVCYNGNYLIILLKTNNMRKFHVIVREVLKYSGMSAGRRVTKQELYREVCLEMRCTPWFEYEALPKW